MDEMRLIPKANGLVWYERDRRAENRYHGNLVFSKELRQSTRWAICAKFAEHAKPQLPVRRNS